MKKNISMMVIFLVARILFSGCSSKSTTMETPPKIGTPEWYLVVEQKTGVVDDEGHGPDTGSTEWLEAVSKQVDVYDSQGHGPDLDSSEWKRCVHRKLFNEDPIN
jgi:hypothetical protein